MLDSQHEIAGLLRLRGRGDDHAGIVFELVDPRSQVGCAVLEAHRVQNARLVRQERRSQLGNQLLLGIPFGAKSRLLCDPSRSRRDEWPLA